MIIEFTRQDREGRIDIKERTLDYTPEDVVGYHSLRSALNSKMMDTKAYEEVGWQPAKKYVDATDEYVREEVIDTLESLDAEYEEVEGNEKSKSLYPHYVNRELEVRRRAQDVDPDQEEKIREAFREQIWPDDINKAPSWQSDDDVTEQTQRWVEAIFDMRDPLFDQYDDIPQAAALTIKETIKKSLTQPQGWSLDSVVNNLLDEFDHMEKYQAARIARQEIAATLNEAQRVSLEARASAEEGGDEPDVRWNGPQDSDTTELCEEVKEMTKDGVPLSELEDILAEKAEEYEYGTPHRVKQMVPHWQCRHSLEEAE